MKTFLGCLLIWIILFAPFGEGFAQDSIDCTAPASPGKLARRDEMKIALYLKQLNEFPSRRTPFSKVRSVVTKLVKLDPKKAGKYFVSGVKKLKRATPLLKIASLQARVTKIATKSGYYPTWVETCKCVAPTPSPTP